MSTACRLRKIKPPDPGQQHNIRKFISDCTNVGLLPPKIKGSQPKKRQRSTGEKNKESRRKQNSPKLIDSAYVEVQSALDNTDQIQLDQVQEVTDITTTMSNVHVTPQASDATTMLTEIKKMELRLTASIKETRYKEMSDMEERLSNIISTTISEAVKGIQSSLNTLVDNNPIIQTHSTEIVTLRNENTALNRRLQQLTAEQLKIKKQLVKIETKNLDHSLIIRGVPEDYKETEQHLIYKVHQTLSILMQGDSLADRLECAKRMTIRTCRRLGRFNRNRIRPLSLELVHKDDVEFILDNRMDLERGIYVDREYPLEIERKRKTLLPVLKAAKKLTDYKKQCRMDDDRIVIKGKTYTVNTLNQLPEELSAFKVTSKEDQETVGFFGEINPLSNFHLAPFCMDGVEYISSEQYIQACKAKYFGDSDTLCKILGSTTSIECKEISRNIRNYDDNKWEQVAGNLCHPGIRAKFAQNPIVLNTLLTKTGDKRIVECASDRLWGTGLPLSDPDCLDRMKWISQGILGQILEDIRNEFKDADRRHYQQTTPPATNKAASIIANVPTPNQPINNVPDQHECDLHTSDQDTTVNVKNMEVT